MTAPDSRRFRPVPTARRSGVANQLPSCHHSIVSIVSNLAMAGHDSTKHPPTTLILLGFVVVDLGALAASTGQQADQQPLDTARGLAHDVLLQIARKQAASKQCSEKCSENGRDALAIPSMTAQEPNLASLVVALSPLVQDVPLVSLLDGSQLSHGARADDLQKNIL